MSEKGYSISFEDAINAFAKFGKVLVAHQASYMAKTKYKVGSIELEALFDNYDYDEIQEIVAESKRFIKGDIELESKPSWVPTDK